VYHLPWPALLQAYQSLGYLTEFARLCVPDISVPKPRRRISVGCAKKKSRRLPVILTKEEVKRLLDRLQGADFSRNEIVVRDGKGDKDRYTMLPAAFKESLLQHLRAVKRQHDDDLQRGLGRVSLPNALERKYPNAGKAWGWQWVFPASGHYTDGVTGEKRRRHHLHESVLQRAVKEARLKAAIVKPATCHTFAIPLPPTCSRTATTSGPSKSFWATRMSAQR
jgi:integrase